jgi:predicted Zn-dependent protease
MINAMFNPVRSGVLAALLIAVTAFPAQAQNNLPSLGDRISGTVSLDQEYQMGQQFLSQIRRSAPTIPDALLNDYLEFVTYRLASRSQLKDHRLSFVIIDSEELNAFAAPGGIIGVNTGLFLNARTEDEFASVMAHEIAHVSQRHFARGIDEAQSGRIPQLGALLASVLIMATSDAGHGAAAVTAAQGMAVENQLRFSRSNEAEADRIGQDTMFNAGFDPDAMASLFERLMAVNRFGRRPPEFLLSHPLTESRIADSRGRAMRYPDREYSSSLEYQFMRARVVGHYSTDKAALVDEYRRRLETSSNDTEMQSNRYALAVAYWENEQYGLATQTLTPLLERYPNRITLVVTQAEILTAQNEPGQARAFLERHLEINPNNHPLTMAYVDALQEGRNYQRAAEMMEQHTRNRPNDHHLWFQLAETWGQAGNISKVHQARAEYYRLLGDYGRAREQLQFAIRVASENNASPAEEARLRQKIRDIEQMQRQRARD